MNKNKSIKFEVDNTTVDIHPAIDPREIREYSQSKNGIIAVKKQWYCCWPFSICCKKRPKHHKQNTRIDFDPTSGTPGHVPMNRNW